MALPLNGRVAVVTGGSRGIGRGIALALGEAGATVYLSGRTVDKGVSPWSGTITETAADVTRLGGQGIAVACDHRDDAEVRALFQRVANEAGGLDVLVNNVASFGDAASGYPPEGIPFWQVPVAVWDEMHSVGLRSHYVASSCAAPLMIVRRAGLIVNISSLGAMKYVFGAAYGAAKAGVDKLTADMAHELQSYDVAVVSLWPPFTKTEKYISRLKPDQLSKARTPQFTGRAVVALASDARIMEKTGRVFRVIDLSEEYGFRD